MATLECPKQEECPGCPLGAAEYEAGVVGKGEQVRGALAGFADLAPVLKPARPASPVVGYRLRAKLVSDARALGLYERGGHRVVDVSGCRVLSPSLTAASEAVRRRLPLPIYGVDLRETSEGVLVTLLCDHASARAELLTAARALHESGDTLSVAIALRPEGNVRLLAGEPEVVAGPALARHRLSEEAPYAYAAHGGFVQAHAAQASYVQQAIAGGLAARAGALAGLEILELFAGNGSLALGLARAGAKVTAVEAFAPAITLAERAAREQNLELVAVASDAARFLASEPTRRYDAVVVNPPRRGVDPDVRRALAVAAPRALAYVSCNPRTLARDSWHLQLLGLALESVEPLDMIPWSDAVEALAWLGPRKAPEPRVLFENDEWLAFERAGWQGEPSGVAWRAKTPAGAESLRQALASAESELTLLCRGNLRKQGTVTRRHEGRAARGVRYKKLRSFGRHSLLSAVSDDADALGALRDLASIGHPVLGDARHGDARSNQHVAHRHGLDRAFVHCAAMRLRTPSGTELRVSCELAPDLAQVLASLDSD